MATLNPEEIESLMAAIDEGTFGPPPTGPNAPSGPVSSCDLTNPERNIPEPLAVLEQVGDEIARLFASALVGRTRFRVSVQTTRVTRSRYEQLFSLMSPPNLTAVIQLGTSDDAALLIVERDLAERLLMAGLGGSGNALNTHAETIDNELTALERQVLMRLLGLICTPIRTAYANVIKLRPKLLRVESDPRLAATASQSSVAILSSFRMEGELEGQFQLAVPFSALEPARELLVGPVRKPLTVDPAFQAALQAHINAVEVDVTVSLGYCEMSLSRLQNLQPGDVLTLDTDEASLLDVHVGDRLKFLARPTVRNSNVAVTIEDVVNERSAKAKVVTSVELARQSAPEPPGLNTPNDQQALPPTQAEAA